MKKFFALAAAIMASGAVHATDFSLASSGQKGEVVDPDSTGFKFTDIKVVKSTPVKDQNKSGTCWAFAGTGLLENEVLRKGGPEVDLSEMFIVRKCYDDKADKYVRTNGNVNFAQGGSFADVLYVLDRYGLVPEDVYDGLNYGEEKHSHYEMADGLTGYLKGVSKNANKRFSTAWKDGYEGILDAYLGQLPEKFTYKGKEVTPKEYAAALGLNADDFITVTSFTHHPFYKPFALEIADNWLWAESQNVPLEEMQAIVDNAIENGYAVGWAADVSEPTFKWYKGYALLPAAKAVEDMDNAEVARWSKLSDKDREAEKNEINGPVKERVITQESRQKAFDSQETTDDHGMVIIGIAQDQEGNKYYKVKNSWDTNQVYDGYIYVSVPFFLDKTIGVTVNKNAVPKEISKKFQ